MNIRGLARQIALVLVFASFACGGGDSGGNTPSVGSAGGAPPAAAPSTPAAGAATGSATLVADMRTHLTRLKSAGGDVIVPQIPEHTSMVNQLLTQLTQAHPTPTPAWTALADSVRQDLTRMASMDAAGLDEFIDQHADRVTRLMDMP